MAAENTDQVDHQKVLICLSEELAAPHEEEEICQSVVRSLYGSQAYAFVGIFLVDEKTGDRVLTSSAGWNVEPGSVRLSSGEGLSEDPLLDEKPHYTLDVAKTSRYISKSTAGGSQLDIPIWIAEKVQGVLSIETEQADGFGQTDIDFLKVAAQLAGISLHKARLYISLQVENETARILRNAHLALAQSLDMDVLCDTLLDAFHKLIPYDSATIFLMEGEKRLRARAVRGYEKWVDPDQALNVAFEYEPGTSMHIVVNTRKGLVVPDTRKFPQWIEIPSSKHILSFLGVPMLACGKVTGVCSFDGAETNQFSDKHIQLAEALATQAAFAIENAFLFDELHKAKVAAETANNSKSAFVANVSHELRTPLTSILGFAKVIHKRLNEKLIPQLNLEDQKNKRICKNTIEEIDIIISEGERLTALINDLLDLSKIEAGKSEWQMKPLAISSVIERALTSISTLFKESGLELIVDIEKKLPPVIGDNDRLVQVMINLLSNAIKFTYKGSVTCRAARVKDEVLISVIDTGTGIKKEEHLRVFEEFTQVSGNRDNKLRGTGLGLPICKQIIEHHGGRIWVESEPGCGCNFSFTLPIKV